MSTIHSKQLSVTVHACGQHLLLMTAVAVMLLRVHWFVADHTRRTLAWAKLYHICRVGGRWVREHQSPGY